MDMRAGVQPDESRFVPLQCRVRYVRRPAGDEGSSTPSSIRRENGAGQPGERPVDVWVACGGSSDDGKLGVRFEHEGDVLRVVADAHVDVDVRQCSVDFSFDFGARDRILANGYQSWTDTVELGPRGRMRGLGHVPKPIVDRWVLDGGGDYAFAPYPGRPGRLHGFTYLDVRNGGRHDLLASLDEDNGFTMLDVDAPAGSVVAEKECPLKPLAAGSVRVLCELAVVSGSLDDAYDRWFSLSGIRALDAAPLVGYSSWYRHYGDIDAVKLEADLEGACGALANVDCTGLRTVFQIDDGYCAVGDWVYPRAERFPEGLAPLAASIREAGFLPGIWVAPFVCERNSRVANQHPDWLLRDDEGRPVRTGSQWSGGLALDTLNPAVRRHVLDSLRTLTREWGFGLVKADFLYGACMRPHGGRNRGQLMADALCLLREAVGPDVAIVGCGVPLGSAFGRVEYCRIGCDVGLDWDDAPYMRLLHRERVSTRNSLANTVYRAPLDGRAFGNDPDVFFLRDDVKLSAARRRDLLAVDAAYGSMLLTSDDMGSWDDDARGLFQAAVDVLRERKGLQ